MIRPLFQNVTILILFLLPMITMRTYSEEKRSGTIELLLTSPLTDMQIILGKFLGAMALYAVMLAVTLIHVAHPVRLRQPGVEADRDRLPGPAAARRLLHLGRLFISSLTKNQIVAVMVTFARLPAPLGHQLDRQLRRADRRAA